MQLCGPVWNVDATARHGSVVAPWRPAHCPEARQWGLAKGLQMRDLALDTGCTTPSPTSIYGPPPPPPLRERTGGRLLCAPGVDIIVTEIFWWGWGGGAGLAQGLGEGAGGLGWQDEMTIMKLPFVICCAGMCNGCRVTVRVEPLMALSMNLQLSQHPGYALFPLHCLHKS